MNKGGAHQKVLMRCMKHHKHELVSVFSYDALSLTCKFVYLRWPDPIYVRVGYAFDCVFRQERFNKMLFIFL